jgi:hypothetical protein
MISARDPQASPDPGEDGITGAVCWLAATCTECGALIEGATCWNCGARRADEWGAAPEDRRSETTVED